MENIYKVKIKTNPDTRGSYPSERRYSASTVLGLGVVHLFLAATALLLAALSLSVNTTTNGQQNGAINTSMATDSVVTSATYQVSSVDSSIIESLSQTIDTSALNDSAEGNATSSSNSKSSSNVCVTVAPCLMSLGALTAGLTALLAWKRWYIDHNITWFLSMAAFSTVTAAVAVLITLITLINVYESSTTTNTPPPYYDFASKPPSVRFVLTVNVLIATVLELVWSVLSARIAYAGMRNDYPEDIVLGRHHGKMVVSTVHKGNRKLRISPPDILDHFPDARRKLTKYFPSMRDAHGRGLSCNGGVCAGVDTLPHSESNAEYQDRVRRFLNGSASQNQSMAYEADVVTKSVT